MSHPILKHFAYTHLPDHLQAVSAHFGELAATMDDILPDCDEKDMGLRKLLEAKDCMVRAAIETPRQEADAIAKAKALTSPPRP